MWDQAKKVLIKDMNSRKDKVIENAIDTFIAIGKREMIPQLIDILHQWGHKAMAETYLNCGNKHLAHAAWHWAKRHGPHIQINSVSSPVRWSSW